MYQEPHFQPVDRIQNIALSDMANLYELIYNYSDSGDADEAGIPVSERSTSNKSASRAHDHANGILKDTDSDWPQIGSQISSNREKEEHHGISEGLHRVGNLLSPDAGKNVYCEPYLFGRLNLDFTIAQ